MVSSSIRKMVLIDVLSARSIEERNELFGVAKHGAQKKRKIGNVFLGWAGMKGQKSYFRGM
jgi:hypothetical protein